MFINFADASCSIPTEIDVCIVGSGVMGLAMASHLLNHSSKKILLVEEGGLEDTPSSSAVAAELQGGDLASAVANSRARGFGGSSRRWGGQALPFTALDLADRPFLAQRGGWPISWEELNRFYPAADRFLGLTSMPFTTDLWKRQAVTAPFAEGSDLELSISKYSPHAYLASVYQNPITTSKQADCLINAKVASVLLEADGARAYGVNVRNGHGRETTIAARVVVLCGGGIENPRILLASQQLDRRGVGNQADLVGRYYQDHIGFFAAELRPKDWARFRHLFASFVPGDQKYVPKIQLAQSLQRSQELLNVTGNIDVQEDENSPRNCARRIYHRLRRTRPNYTESGSIFRDLRRLAFSAPEALDLLSAHLLDHRIGLPQKARFFLMANAESEPMHASRITLSDQLDRYGLNRPQVNWLVSDLTLKALKAYGNALKNTLESANIAEVKLSPYLTDPAAKWKERAYSLYHHMGATRMSSNPKEGVVDSHGRVHGIKNLYIAGTSVLPSGSASNPSYTALALAFRSAEHMLRQES
jgi:choline dehydrogenase-like flavoprotein